MSDRKPTDEALHGSGRLRDHLASVVDNSLNEILIYDPDSFELRYANRGALKSLGYTFDEMRELAPVDLRPNFTPEIYNDVVSPILKGEKEIVVFEATQKRKDGSLYPVEVHLQLAKDLPEKSVIEIILDITDRKQNEELLEKQMQTLTSPTGDPQKVRLEDLFDIADIQQLQDQFSDATGVASIITHTDGSPITEPSNFCNLCINIIRQTEKGRANCYKSDAQIGQWNPDGPKIQPCLSGGLWDAGAGISVEGRHIANWLIGQVRDTTQTDDNMRAYAREIGADEEEVVKAFHEVPSMSSDRFGKVSQVLFTLANQLSEIAYKNMQQARFISELQQAEQEKEKLQTQLLHSQKMESIGHLAGGVAHDFNNMLGIIMGSAQLAMSDLDPDSDPHMEQEVIIDTAKRAKDLTYQLLTFARREEPDVKPTNIYTLVKNLQRMLERGFPKTIKVETKLQEDVADILVDENQIRQALLNICNNAADSMPGGGTLTISTEEVCYDEKCRGVGGDAECAKCCCIRVSDTGTGIPKTLKDKIFNPFFTTKGIGKGTGLGLSVTHGIIKSHNGTIFVESELGQGTTISVYLPFARDFVGKETHQRLSKPVRGKERILVVDDEPQILEKTSRLLQKKGYEVIQANGGTEAIEIFRAQYASIDIVVLDFIMPEMNAWEVYTNMKRIQPAVKVIIASGYSEEGGISELLNAGAKGMVQKPFEIEKLCEVIREVLGP